MHDSWPVCGAEHHPNVLAGDERYKKPYTRQNKPEGTVGKDLCRLAWKNKRKWLSRKNIIFVGVSRWESKIQKDSSLFGKCKGYAIPNILDKNIFCPKDKAAIRKAFGIPEDKKVIGFGAAQDGDFVFKGGGRLLDALALLDKKDYLLMTFGLSNKKRTESIGIPCIYTGFIGDPVKMAEVYNAMDVFVNPSLIENLSFTCLEAISCGVAAVAFDVGGTSDIVESGVTGYLARPYSAEDLAHGIESVLQDSKRLGENAAAKARRDFDNDNIVQKYINVYNEAIESRKKRK